MVSSIRQKIISFTVLPITVIYILLFAISLYILVSSASREVQQHMREVVFHNAGEVDSLLQQSARIADTVATFAAHPPLAAPTVNSNHVFITQTLARYNQLDGLTLYKPRLGLPPEITGVVRSHDGGAITVSSDHQNSQLGLGEDLKDIRTKQWHAMVRSTDNRWSTPYKNAAGNLVVSYSSPIIQAGRITGMASVDIALDYLKNQLNPSRRLGFALLPGLHAKPITIERNKNDQLTYHSSLSPEQLQSLINGARKKESKQHFLRPEKSGNWSVYAPIQANDWLLIAYTSRHDALETVRKNAIMIAALLLFSLVMIVACVWFVSALITRPLRKLNNAVKRVADGELPTRLKIHNNDETGALARNFVRMARQLSLRDEALRQERHANLSRMAQGLRGRYYYFAHDQAGQMTFVSPSISDILGYSQEEFCTHYTKFLSHSSHNEISVINTERVLNGEDLSNTYEIELLHKDGRARQIELFKVAVREPDGSISGAEGLGHDITDRINDTRKFRSLLESAPDAMLITTLQGEITLVNRQAEQLFSHPRQQLVGQLMLNLISPSHRTPYKWRLSQISTQKPDIPHALESQVCSSDHREIPVEMTFSRFDTEDGSLIALAIRDITDRKQADEALRQSEERYRRLVEGLQKEYFFYSHNAAGHYTYVSPSVTSILGYSSEEFRQHNQLYLNDSPRNQVVQETVAAVARGEWRPPYICEFRHADGSTRILEVLEVAALNSRGQVTAVEGIARDITRNKLAEEELRRARDAAEAANRAKSQFLSNMSHELRTPLNGVLGYTQILQRDKNITDAQQHSLRAIESCGQHLLTLINDVLDLSKIENGGIELTETPTRLQDTLNSIHTMLWERACSKHLTFEIETTKDVPLIIMVDETKLRQILVNLVGNAIKFTHLGYVKVEVSMQNGSLRFVVRDSGIGIAEEALKTIFEPFKQSEGGIQSGGTGLGLTISQHLVHILKGQLNVTSTLGKGSEFSFSIPVKALQHSDYQETPSGLDDGKTWHLIPGVKPRIMVVDDNHSNRDILLRLLKGAGFITTGARNGQEALALLEQHPADLVLMDIHMPVMNGLEATEKIKASPKLKQIKVIAVTANVFPELRQQIESSGCDDFVGKPYRAADIFKVIGQHLNLTYHDHESCYDPEKAMQDLLEGLSAKTLDFLAKELRSCLELGDITAVNHLAEELRSKHGDTVLTDFIDMCWQEFDLDKLEALQQIINNALDAQVAVT